MVWISSNVERIVSPCSVIKQPVLRHVFQPKCRKQYCTISCVELTYALKSLVENALVFFELQIIVGI